TQRRVEHRLGGAFAVDELAVDQELGLHVLVLFGTVVISPDETGSKCGSGLAREGAITFNIDVG
ncbi:hypothetical protein, partial [Pseudomonas putida]|uniref:hypothetical protein n=1 Tax=Pseudomonas putida TaxID=303 RepID=UPI00236452A4